MIYVLEFILIGIILIFVMTYRNSSGEGVYKFVKEQATVIYDQYAPYSYKVYDVGAFFAFYHLRYI